jgi:hypothetical protein
MDNQRRNTLETNNGMEVPSSGSLQPASLLDRAVRTPTFLPDLLTREHTEGGSQSLKSVAAENSYVQNKCEFVPTVSRGITA